MNYYRIFAVARKKEINMHLIFYVQGHNIASAYSRAVNYVKEQRNEEERPMRHGMEIIKIEKVR